MWTPLSLGEFYTGAETLLWLVSLRWSGRHKVLQHFGRPLSTQHRLFDFSVPVALIHICLVPCIWQLFHLPEA